MSPDPSQDMWDLETRMISGGWIMADGVSSGDGALQYRRSHQHRQGTRTGRGPDLDGLSGRGRVGTGACGHDDERGQHQHQGQGGAEEGCCERHAGSMRPPSLPGHERYGCGLWRRAENLCKQGGWPFRLLRLSLEISSPLHLRSIDARRFSVACPLDGL